MTDRRNEEATAMIAMNSPLKPKKLPISKRYVPTLEDIERETERIRAGWSAKRRRDSTFGVVPVSLPTMHDYSLDTKHDHLRSSERLR